MANCYAGWKMLKQMQTKFFLFLLVAFPASLAATELPKGQPVPGGIALIDLKTELKPAQVTFQKKRVLTIRNKESWYAVVGLPLTTKPGKHRIRIKTDKGKSQIGFTVKNKKYATQRLTIKNKRKVNPTAEDLKRIIKEQKIIRKALRTFTMNDNVELNFNIPVKGRFSSPFGLRRFFNGQARKPHSGLDIAAPEGTPIISPTNGIIITIGNYFFNGNTVFIDHGQGLVSMFCHLSRIVVRPGETVKKGQIVGEIGMTGRVTGPHLHWGVSLNDARIEPRLFLSARYQ